MRIAIIGLPGSGKTTQAEMLSKALSIPHIYLGAMLRKLGKEESALGKRVEKTIKEGELVADDLVLTLLKRRLRGSDTQRGFVLGGIPRTANAAGTLLKLVSLDKVFLLKTDDKTAFTRLLKRGREDDTPEVIKRRFVIFKREIGQIVELYRGLGVLVGIDADDDPQVVHQRILAELKQE